MTDSSTPQSSKKPSHIAYQVRDAANGKSYWNRIGVAWSNKGNSFSIDLESVPFDGHIVLRPNDGKEGA